MIGGLCVLFLVEVLGVRNTKSDPPYENVFDEIMAHDLEGIEGIVCINGVQSRQYTEGMTEIAFAAYLGYWEVVEVLARYGADVNYVEPESGNSVLHFAAMDPLPSNPAKSDKSKVFQFLLRQGANTNHRNKEGKTPFEIARENGNRKLAELLRPNF